MLSHLFARIPCSISNSSPPFFLFSRCGGSWLSYGLNCGKGVIVKENAFLNIKSCELFQKGATIAEYLSGLPIYLRGRHAHGALSEISKPQFTKLLKQVTSHISSVSNIYVHDGAIGSTSKHNVKIRMISDSPSAVLAFSNIIWEAPTRAVSHDSCPLTVYAAEFIGPEVESTIGLPKINNGFIAADIDRSMLILCGKAFLDTNGTKETLAALSEPVISARGGLPLPARLLVSGDSVILLFAPEDIIQNCAEFLVSRDAGVILSNEGITTFFREGSADGSNLFKLPSAVVLVTSDGSRTIPSASKLTPGQAAYHFLAGYQNGKFVPAFINGPSSIDPLELAKALLCKLKEQQISSFLINAKGKESSNGKDLVNLTLSKNVPHFQARGGKLKGRYESFITGKYQLPVDFSF